jgi:hypothetical protein
MGDKGESSTRRRPPSVFWPVILIIAGVLFLLDNLGMLHVNFWQLWRLWPILLILAGLDILLAHRSWLGNLVVLVLTLAVIAGVVILLVAAPDVLGPSPSGGAMRIAEPLDGVERADLKVNFAAGQLTMNRLDDSSSLIDGELKLATAKKPVWTVDRNGDRASMSLGYKEGYQSWGEGDVWNLRLSPKAGFSLGVDVGAGGATLDLTGLAIRDLKVQAGAGQTRVIFPAEGQFSAAINGGVGALTIEIPEGMAARLQIERGLSAFSVSNRFKKVGEEYVTGDWTTNENRVDVKITVGIGVLTVGEP